MAAGLLKGELAYGEIFIPHTLHKVGAVRIALAGEDTGVVGGQGRVVVPLVLHYIRGLVVENLQGESIILPDFRQGGLVG